MLASTIYYRLNGRFLPSLEKVLEGNLALQNLLRLALPN